MPKADKKQAKPSVKEKTRRKREPVAFTLDVNVDFGEGYEPVAVVKDRTVVMPDRLLEFRERSIRLLFRSIGKAVAMQPTVMRKIVPIPVKVATNMAKQANKLTSTKPPENPSK